jgi:NADPH-dependent 2,4-dienoyl-CoA reductase/sulfur reductase-like enzyme
MTRILILGGGTAATVMANRLARFYRSEFDAGRTAITVDQDDRHVYQPGLLFVPFGIYGVEEIVRERVQQLLPGVAYVQASIDRVDTDRNVLLLSDGRHVAYDVLIVATGTRVAPEETEGTLGEGWQTKVFDFYTLDGATKLRAALERFEGGRLVINPVDMPIKCPVAPLEFAFLADWYFTKRGIRDRITLTYVTPPRRRLHQAGRGEGAGAPACREAHRDGDRVRHRASRRRSGQVGLLGRPRGAVPPAGHRPAPQRRRVRGPLGGAPRRSRASAFHILRAKQVWEAGGKP